MLMNDNTCYVFPYYIYLQVYVFIILLSLLSLFICSFLYCQVGALFWQLPHTIDSRVSDVSNALVWLTFVGIYIHIFKVYAIVQMKKRYKAEHANGYVHRHKNTDRNNSIHFYT